MAEELLSMDFEPMFEQLRSLKYTATPITYIPIDNTQERFTCGNIYATNDRIVFEINVSNYTWSLIKYKLVFPTNIDIDLDFTEDFYNMVDCPFELFPILSYKQQESLSIQMIRYFAALDAKREHFDINGKLIALDKE